MDRGTPPRPSKKEEEEPVMTVKLPLVTLQVRPPHISPHDMGEAVNSAQASLPPPERLAYYAGLGALAALGIIEWPVAVAIGAGTMLAKRALRRDRSGGMHEEQREEQREEEPGRRTGRAS
jgi:hypothetical protein